ncbi:MAG: amidohydrolase family protein [Halobacteriales archaeon]
MARPEVLGGDPRAIDVHAHPPTAEFLHEAGGPYMADAAAGFGADLETESLEDMVETYRDAGIARAVLLAWDAETNTGRPPVTNEYVAAARDEHPDFFVPFASVDPHKDDCVETARRAVEDLDLAGFKFQQLAQGFDPSAPEHAALFETIETLGAPCIFHGGNTQFGGDSPGGRGLRLRYGHPLLVDDLAARHPHLPIILAHPAFPWEKVQLATCLHKANVYMDLSGWLPRYIDDQVLHYARTLLSEKVMFGTDYPMLDPARWLADFAELGFDPAIQRKILWENAEALLFG